MIDMLYGVVLGMLLFWLIQLLVSKLLIGSIYMKLSDLNENIGLAKNSNDKIKAVTIRDKFKEDIMKVLNDE